MATFTRRASLQFFFGVMISGLLAGFYVFQGLAWLPWWLLSWRI